MLRDKLYFDRAPCNDRSHRLHTVEWQDYKWVMSGEGSVLNFGSHMSIFMARLSKVTEKSVSGLRFEARTNQIPNSQQSRWDMIPLQIRRPDP